MLGIFDLPHLLLHLRFSLTLVELLTHFRVLQAPLFDLVDFTQFFFSPLPIDLILNLVSRLLLPCKLLLVQFEELLPFTELELLLLKLFPHSDLPIASDYTLLLGFSVRSQHVVLV